MNVFLYTLCYNMNQVEKTLLKCFIVTIPYMHIGTFDMDISTNFSVRGYDNWFVSKHQEFKKITNKLSTSVFL